MKRFSFTSQEAYDTFIQWYRNWGDRDLTPYVKPTDTLELAYMDNDGYGAEKTGFNGKYWYYIFKIPYGNGKFFNVHFSGGFAKSHNLFKEITND